MRVVAGIAGLIFSLMFWRMIDSLGAPHTPFDLLDARSLAAFAAWFCAVAATGLTNYAFCGSKKS